MAVSLSELTDLVRGVLRNAELQLDAKTRFEDLPGWEPLNLISVVVEAECRFDLLFELSEIKTLSTVGDLLRMIAGKRAMALV